MNAEQVAALVTEGAAEEIQGHHGARAALARVAGRRRRLLPATTARSARRYQLGTHADLEALAADDDSVRAVVCDVRDEAGLKTAAETFERLDVVVAAAAVIAAGSRYWETPSDDLQEPGRWTRWGCGGLQPSPCR